MIKEKNQTMTTVNTGKDIGDRDWNLSNITQDLTNTTNSGTSPSPSKICITPKNEYSPLAAYKGIQTMPIKFQTPIYFADEIKECIMMQDNSDTYSNCLQTESPGPSSKNPGLIEISAISGFGQVAAFANDLVKNNEDQKRHLRSWEKPENKNLHNRNPSKERLSKKDEKRKKSVEMNNLNRMNIKSRIFRGAF